MSNFHQLQTYLSINAASLPGKLQSIEQCWGNMIGEDQDVTHYLRSIYWANDHSQCTIPNYHGQWKEFQLGNFPKLLIRPLVLLWVPETRRHLSKFWLEVSILIDSQSLADDVGNYLPGRAEVIRKITQILHLSLPEHKGIFLTDEHQDGHPWEGLLTSKPNLMWNMDAAWLLPEMLSDYEPYKDSFSLRRESWGYELLNQERWANNQNLGMQH
ncbi:MAG: hypothetical protein MRZ79_05820 [Bacteroidia bacterium]|nr:hypothetical protein [Bacteroidia bacterium]